ncbi:MAG: hypothetical protein R2697_10655 [Ilumatobacteraceae bacterium]
MKGREFNEIFDIVAVRVIVDSIRDCYAALGSIHGRWRPVPGASRTTSPSRSSTCTRASTRR